MTFKVVELHPKMDADDVATGLRNIADDIEAGAYEFAPNLCAIVLAYESLRPDREGVNCTFQWQSHGLGEKAGVFNIKGLLAAAASSFEGEE